jgi:C-terminal processing protease CtpA/Prc
MIQLLTSFLCSDRERVHLNSFYFRPTNETTQTWTLPFVPGKRNPDAQVFVLTRRNTFSAAGEFTYNLKNLGRGTIVGEVTCGGAHPGGSVPTGGDFTAFIPMGRTINPVTGTNWKGTGVQPQVDVPADQTFQKAYRLDLQKLAEEAEGADKA